MKEQALETFCSINPESLGVGTSADFEFRYLDISAVTKGKIDWAATQLLKFSDAPSRARRLARPGDVLLCTVRPGLQAHTRIQESADVPIVGSTGFIVGSTGFAVLRPNEPSDTSFLFHQLFSERVVAQLRALETGSSYPAINERDIRSIRIFAPRSTERNRVATLLDTIDEAIAKTEAVIAKLKQVRAGLLHDLLTCGLDEHGQLRDPIAHPEQFKDSRLGRIPREWVVSSIDSTVRQPSDLTIGPFGSNLLASDYRSEGTPVVFVRDVREDGFVWTSNIYVDQDKANEIRAHSVFADDVLITKMGLPPCIAAVYPDTMPNGVITADVIRLRPRVDVATSFWLASYINSPRFAACIRKITGGVTRPKVTLTDFRK